MSKIKLSTLIHSELVSGILLMISFVVAILTANIDYCEEAYKKFVFLPVSLGYGEITYSFPLINLVNDGLMTLFFLLIGLELKFHLVCGEFQTKKSFILPTAAAIGGIVLPSLIYILFNYGYPSLEGWAIPIATDTAFMIGIVSFFGKIISKQLRAFIVGFSLVDDALALAILAAFYSHASSVAALTLSAVLILLLILINRYNVKSLSIYLSIGLILWLAMVKAGIHGTLCGIILALAIPVKIHGNINANFNLLENILRPLVYFLILPLFAFINSGINLDNFSKEILMSPITIGIIGGLFIGKPLGVFLFSYLAIKKKWCSLPENVSWPLFFAIAVLGGIGFTLSLFIGDLTFEIAGPNYAMRVGVIFGSLLSALIGTVILVYLAQKQK